MAKDKIKELEYQIEGIKRMKKRKIKRAQHNRAKSLRKLRWLLTDPYLDNW
jgi:hypothetical protein